MRIDIFEERLISKRIPHTSNTAAPPIVGMIISASWAELIASQVNRDRRTGTPGPARSANAMVRPHIASITATPGPRISSPLPQDCPVSSSRSAMPRRRRRGKKPTVSGW